MKDKTPVIDFDGGKQKWIPVTERLPEKRELVLTAAKGVKPFVTWYNDISKKWACCGWCKVTHWMPLPEAPKEDA